MNPLHKHWTQQEKELVLKLRADGLTYWQIGTRIGRTAVAVQTFIKRQPAAAATAAESPAKSQRAMTPRQMIKALYDLGYRIEENQLVVVKREVVKHSDIIKNG